MTSVLVERLARAPHVLFSLDGVGALVTALLVGVVLPALGEHIAMPRPVLRVLALTALVLAIRSVTIALHRPPRWPRYLRGIALANGMYCMATAGCLLFFRARLAIGDWIYFVGELVVVGSLATLEHRVAAEVATTGPGLTAHRVEDGVE